MSTRKPVNFYYSLTNDNNKTVYRTLGDAEYHEVKEKDNLDYKKTINIRMDANFTACDEDLYKYREQFNKNCTRSTSNQKVFHMKTQSSSCWSKIVNLPAVGHYKIIMKLLNELSLLKVLMNLKPIYKLCTFIRVKNLCRHICVNTTKK